jgi:hypothetical protein
LSRQPHNKGEQHERSDGQPHGQPRVAVANYCASF